MSHGSLSLGAPLGLFLVLGLSACSSADVVEPAGTGGAVSTGGTASGGDSATGGANATGGATGTGGATPVSGGTGSGGAATGGDSATGGAATGGSASGGAATGGAPNTGGDSATGGAATGGSATGGAATGGDSGTGGETATGGGSSELGTGTMSGSGSSSEQYATEFVSRNDQEYVLITNGWGPGFQSHGISWNGTSFTVISTTGSAGAGGQPASYPTVFCGQYSVPEIPDCGLPASIASLTSLKTGWRWEKNGNEGEYNAAYDIWMGNGTQFQGYLMVWLRDPPNFQPAGQPMAEFQGVTVDGLPGVWDIWQGMVNNSPIINWVRAEGDDSYEIEFDVMDVIRDAEMRGLDVPGTDVLSVAVGFEIWEGPIDNLETVDFYVDVE